MMPFYQETGELSESSTKTVEWRIKNFSLYSETGVGFRSPAFRASNYFWYLIIRPNYKHQNNKSFVSLYFINEEDDRVAPYSTNVDFAFGIKTLQDEVINKREDTWEINKNGWVGFEDFIERSKLFGRKEELLPSDTLTVTCWAQVKGEAPDMTTRLYKLTANFKELFISQKNTDIFIEVKGRKFSAHKCILLARCPMLTTMIDNEQKNKRTEIVNITDCDPKAFYVFLLYLYSGQLDFSKCNVFALYRIANKYAISELKLSCADLMIRRLSVNNMCETYVFGHTFNDGYLLNGVQKFFEKNFKQIVISGNWKAFIETNGQIANNLLIEMSPKVNVEDDSD